jgi:drug/metabolite transporter, DME family
MAPDRRASVAEAPLPLVSARPAPTGRLDGHSGLFNNASTGMPSARLLVLLSAVCFGTTGTAQALGPDASPPAVGAARVLVGGLLLVLVAARFAPRATAPWSARAVLAVEDTGVAVGTVVALGSGPVFAGLLGRLVHGEPLTRRWSAATALAVAGVGVLVASGAAAEVHPAGVLLALGAGLSYAAYTVAAKDLLGAGHAPEAVMARLFGLGALALLPVLVLDDPGDLASPGGVALAVYLGAVPTALAYVLFARGLRHLPAGEVATLTLAEPLTATALGAVVLGERPGGLALGGVALVLAGLAVLAAPRRRRGAPELVPA